jgi:hypothetical protein
MSTRERSKRWLPDLSTTGELAPVGAVFSTDAGDALDAYYRDLRRLAEVDVRTNRPLAPLAH